MCNYRLRGMAACRAISQFMVTVVIIKKQNVCLRAQAACLSELLTTKKTRFLAAGVVQYAASYPIIIIVVVVVVVKRVHSGVQGMPHCPSDLVNLLTVTIFTADLLPGCLPFYLTCDGCT